MLVLELKSVVQVGLTLTIDSPIFNPFKALSPTKTIDNQLEKVKERLQLSRPMKLTLA